MYWLVGALPVFAFAGATETCLSHNASVTCPAAFGCEWRSSEEAPAVGATSRAQTAGASGYCAQVDMAEDFLERTPPAMNAKNAHPATYAKTAEGGVISLGVFHSQETDRFNALIGKIKGAGLTVHDPDADELAAWKAVAPAAQARIVSEMGGNAAEVWDRVQAAKAACTN